MELDTNKIDEAVLALLYLGLHDRLRVWKSFDWEAMNRLHEQGFIADPRSKAKSVLFTSDGLVRAEELLVKLFGKRAEWFPHLKRGMVAGERVLREYYGRSLTGVLVEVIKVHTHPVDTTAAGCERYGSEFIVELGRFRASTAAVGARASESLHAE